MIEYIDDEPITFRKFKKTVHNGTDWEDIVFYEIKENQKKAGLWLKEKYGNQVYCKTWWQTHTSICMSEKIYTHYALSVL
jgi:hypothetical protein